MQINEIRGALGAAALYATLFIATPAPSHATGATLEATYSTSISNGWVRVERWHDPGTAFTQETFPPDGRGNQSGQRVTFFNGIATPHSSRFLLYYAPAWDTNPKATPVLLVHGANQDADLAWANPNDAGAYGCGRSTCPTSGLMQALASAGFKVFAISFAHKNGNGYFWSEQIEDAIQVIKSRTSASTVDVISWSKGAFNARMYISSVKQAWGSTYQADVRRLIMLGGPNNGIDLSFRHGWYFSLPVYPACGGTIDGPTPHDKLVCFGVWQNGPQWTYSSAYFPGSAQMLKRWDSVYPLPTAEQDWYTTYYGGLGFYTHGNGILAYMGPSLIDTVRTAGTSAGVRVYNLCGNTPDIALLHNEHTGPSDGVVFIASCNDATGINNFGGSAVIAVNHLGLGWNAAAVTQVKSWLNAP
ncbi:MAG: esterase/lipase family protein [Steroidobacteraceae bacterium]